MAALGSPEGPAPAASTRRELLVRGAVGTVAALATTSVLTAGIYEGYEKWEQHESHEEAQSMFQDILFHGEQLGDYEGLLQINPDVTVSSSMFGDADKSLSFSDDDEFYVAVRPIAVVQTLLANAEHYSASHRALLGRALQDIPGGLLAFYQPGPKPMVYLDVDKNLGLLTPLNTSPDNGQPIPVSTVKVSGRKVHEGVVYPYTTDSFYAPDTNERTRLAKLLAAGQKDPNKMKAYWDAEDGLYRHRATEEHRVTQYQVIGHSTSAANNYYLNAMADEFRGGAEPIALPQSPASPPSAHIDLRSNPLLTQSAHPLP